MRHASDVCSASAAVRQRRVHTHAVEAATPHADAASLSVDPCSTKRTSSRRPRGVRRALGCCNPGLRALVSLSNPQALGRPGRLPTRSQPLQARQLGATSTNPTRRHPRIRPSGRESPTPSACAHPRFVVPVCSSSNAGSPIGNGTDAVERLNSSRQRVHPPREGVRRQEGLVTHEGAFVPAGFDPPPGSPLASFAWSRSARSTTSVTTRPGRRAWITSTALPATQAAAGRTR